MTLTPPTDVRETRDGDLAGGHPPVSSSGSELAAPAGSVAAAAGPDAEGAGDHAADASPGQHEVSPPEAASAGDDGVAARPARASAPEERPERGRGPQRRRGRGERPPVPAERGFPRAERPGNVPAPQHHHLPGWVRRDFAKARPALADLLGLLQGEDRAHFQQRVDDLTAGITAGRFSLAWQYPALIEEGQKVYEGQRTRIAETQRVQRQVEAARRRSGERLRDAGDVLGADASARLGRSLRQAQDLGSIVEVDAEVDRALSAARSAGSRRRDREIERTRSRLFRTLPKAALVEEPQPESWQDVLRRFAEEQGMEQQTAGAGTAD